MCTVSYVPCRDGFVFTSNRDVSYLRTPAVPPKIQIEGHLPVLMPIDPQGEGTWIGVSPYFDVVCLLNGGFDFHQSAPPYRHSRGILVKNLLCASTFESFSARLDCHNIEPFTLIAVKGQHIHELVWTGEKVHIQKLPPNEPHIWSSSTLYTPEMQAMRRQWFEEHLSKYPHNAASMQIFHEKAGIGDPAVDVMMDRPSIQVGTVSTTMVHQQKGRFFIHYWDRKTNEHKKLTFEPRISRP